MITSRKEALAVINIRGGYKAAVLSMVYRLMNSECFRSYTHEAKLLMLLAEDWALQFTRDSYKFGSPHILADRLRIYSAVEGAKEPFRIYFNPETYELRIKRRGPRLFFSHRHQDYKVTAALVQACQASFEIFPGDVRCTSVRPYRLPAGSKVFSQLRKEIIGAEAVMGLIAPGVTESGNVVFELGIAWSHGCATLPLLIHGAEIDEVPDPIRDRVSLSLNNPDDGAELLDELERLTTLKRRAGVSGDVSDKLRLLAELASA